MGGRPGKVKRLGNLLNFNCNVEKFYLVNDAIMEKLLNTTIFFSNVSENTVLDILSKAGAVPVREIMKHTGQISRHYGLEHDSVFFKTVNQIHKTNNVKPQTWTMSISYVNRDTCIGKEDAFGNMKQVMIGDWCLYDENSKLSQDKVIFPCDRSAAQSILSSGSSAIEEKN